jgi:3-oxoacyl-[acyl-carrier-protein] synthase II
MPETGIVVTGIGVVSCVGCGKNSFWKNLKAGRSGIKTIKLFKPFDQRCCIAGEISNFDFKRELGQKGLAFLDRSTKFLMVAAKQALKESQVQGPEIGVVVGTDWANLERNFRFYDLILTKGPRAVSPMDFPGTLTNFAAGRVGIRYGLTGLNATLSRGFASGLDAIGYAMHMIKQKQAKKILAGSVENLSIELYTFFYKNSWLRKGKNNSRGSRGVVLGEGASMVVLEEKNSAIRRGAPLLAEVKGYGFSSGESKESMEKCMRLALEDARVKPDDIDLIFLNANGSKQDEKETVGIHEIFGKTGPPYLSAIKFLTGECFGATGGLQVVSACLSLKKKINMAMVNSFGLDGNNSSLILKRIS